MERAYTRPAYVGDLSLSVSKFNDPRYDCWCTRAMIDKNECDCENQCPRCLFCCNYTSYGLDRTVKQALFADYLAAHGYSSTRPGFIRQVPHNLTGQPRLIKMAP